MPAALQYLTDAGSAEATYSEVCIGIRALLLLYQASALSETKTRKFRFGDSERLMTHMEALNYSVMSHVSGHNLTRQLSRLIGGAIEFPHPKHGSFGRHFPNTDFPGFKESSDQVPVFGGQSDQVRLLLSGELTDKFRHNDASKAAHVSQFNDWLNRATVLGKGNATYQSKNAQKIFMPSQASGDCLLLSVMGGHEISYYDMSHPSPFVRDLVERLRECATDCVYKWMPRFDPCIAADVFPDEKCSGIVALEGMRKNGKYEFGGNKNVARLWKCAVAFVLGREIHEVQWVKVDNVDRAHNEVLVFGRQNNGHPPYQFGETVKGVQVVQV